MTSEIAETVDNLTHTFARDREFCAAVLAAHPLPVGRLLVYERWAQNYMKPILGELLGIAEKHFPEANREAATTWTAALVSGIYWDLGLVPYLVLRGLIWEAGPAARRSLEHVGALAAFWQDVTKVQHLSDHESRSFKDAFLSERNPAIAAQLKMQKIQKRFAACSTPTAMSELYGLLSKYTVHGGSLNHTARMLHDQRSRAGCMFTVRPDASSEEVGRAITIIGNAAELFCIELAHLVGTHMRIYGRRPSKGGEGGFYLSRLLDSPAEMTALLCATLVEFGVALP